MGAGYLHTCTKCGYEVSTSGPWEFYRDAAGNRKPYGHPAPISDEAEKRGIYGFSAQVYCSHCDEVFDVILVEFSKPCDRYDAWLGRNEPKDEFTRPNAVKCPKCGNLDLILEPRKDTQIYCPRCADGILVGRMEWIS